MKKVLMPVAIYQDNPIIPIHGARPTYIEKITKYNLIPIFVDPLMSWKMIDELYEMCDGAYFIGGEDWNPKLYGQKKHKKTFVGEQTRDEIELPLLKRILKDRKPFLGLCRGGQGLAIASGGTLIQHIPDKFPGENHNPNKIYDDLLTSPKHKVIIDKQSKTFSVIKKGEIMVNSYHHQAVDKPGKNIRIVGKSPAGVTEIIEHEDKNYFCVGFGCHPEAENKEFSERMFKEFAIAVKSYKK